MQIKQANARKVKTKKVNYLEVKQSKNERNIRKRAVGKFILKKVEDMKNVLTSEVACEISEVQQSSWTELIHHLDAEHHAN